MYESFKFEYSKKGTEPKWDLTKLDIVKLRFKLFQQPSFAKVFADRYNLTEAFLEQLATKTYGQSHRIISMCGETGSGKSLCAQMIARMIAENTGVPFVKENIVFTFEELLVRCKTIPANATMICDESVLTTGMGALRERLDIMNIENVTRKFGLNIIWVYPEPNIRHSTAHIELETVCINSGEKLSKLAMKKGNYYFGYIILDVSDAMDMMWTGYNKEKDKFITSVMNRKMRRMDYEKYAKVLLEDKNYRALRKLSEMKAYARMHPDIPDTFVEAELNQIAFLSVRIKRLQDSNVYQKSMTGDIGSVVDRIAGKRADDLLVNNNIHDDSGDVPDKEEDIEEDGI